MIYWKVKNNYKICSFLLIFLAIISPPFVFAEMISFGRELRAIVMLTLLFLFFLQNNQINKKNLVIFILLVFIIILEILIERSELYNTLSFYGLLLIIYLNYLTLKRNREYLDIFLNFWKVFSLYLSLAALISFLIHQFTIFNIEIFNFEPGNTFESNYNYRMSIFGFTIAKNVIFFEITRVCSFLNEPQYAGAFFLFNILIAKTYKDYFSKKFIAINFIAGLLTFSITFYLAYFVSILTTFKKKIYCILMIPLFLFLVLIYYHDIQIYIFDYFYNNSSLSDRIERDVEGLKRMKDISFVNLIIGNGYNSYTKFIVDDFGRYISSGYLNLIYDFGIIIFLLIIILLLNLYKHLNIILIILIYLFAYPIYKYYFFWYFLVFIILYNKKYFHRKALPI
jgi:hypothetical protein